MPAGWPQAMLDKAISGSAGERLALVTAGTLPFLMKGSITGCGAG
jgi:hypothetical protein